jgi:hypothetical protein
MAIKEPDYVYVSEPYKVDALNNGEVEFLMDQSDVVKPGDVYRDLNEWGLKGGLCSGLTLHWMALTYHHQAFPTREITVKYPGTSPLGPTSIPYGNAAIKQAAINQVTAHGTDTDSPNVFLSRVTAVMTGYGIPVYENTYGAQKKPVNGFFLLEEMRRSGLGIYYVGLRRPDDDPGGHALAIENGGSFYRLFDANNGCFHLSSRARFLEFFGAFLQREGYPLRCTASTWMARIGRHLKDPNPDLRNANYKDKVEQLHQRQSMLRPWSGSPFDHDRLHDNLRRPMSSSRASPYQ